MAGFLPLGAARACLFPDVLDRDPDVLDLDDVLDFEPDALDFDSDVFDVAMVSTLLVDRAEGLLDESSGQFVLHRLGVLLGQRPLGSLAFDLLQLATDDGGVVVLTFSLFAHHLRNGGHAANRREGQRQQSGEQAHRQTSGTKS